MGTYENFYLNQIKQLQEENKQLREALNEARIRTSPLSMRFGDEPRDPKTVSEIMSNLNRNVKRKIDTHYILSALVEPNHEINKPENADERASIIRVLGDMGLLRVEKEWKAGTELVDAILPGGRPAAQGGPGTGTANREDMERYIRATRSRSQGGYGYHSLRDKPNS